MSGPASPAGTRYGLFAGSAYDPTVAGSTVAWQRPGGVALIRQEERTTALPGTHPALAGERVAWRDGDTVVVADTATLRRRERLAAPGGGVIALSEDLLAWRARDSAGTDSLWVRALELRAVPRLLLEATAPEEIGRPALLGGAVLCHVAGPRGSRLLAIDAATGGRRVLRSDPGAQLYNPSTDGSHILYVRATGRQQELRLGSAAPGAPSDDERLMVHASPGRRDPEHERGRRRHRQGYRGNRPVLPPRARPGVVATLWTTALARDAAYVTRLRTISGEGSTADILRVGVPAPG